MITLVNNCINKKIDNYYTYKLVEFIKEELKFYDLDKKIINTDFGITIYIKKPIYNDEQYRLLCRYRKEKAFEIMCNQQEVRDMIHDKINQYLKEE